MWIVSSIRSSRTIWQDFETVAHHPYPTGSSSWARLVFRSGETARGEVGTCGQSCVHRGPSCVRRGEVPARGYVEARLRRLPPAPPPLSRQKAKTKRQRAKIPVRNPELLPFALWFLPFAL